MPHGCSEAQPVAIEVNGTHRVSALVLPPAGARACFVLAHGAGAGMTHPFMTMVANGLAQRGIASLRYHFPYMEQRAKRPDRPELAQATVRAAVAEALRILPGMPLIAGGKSFGGRMSSQAQAAAALHGVRGFAFLGFPLHPAKRPSVQRARHLLDVRLPMLFLQGERDALADPELIRLVTRQLGERATLHLIADADHSFHVPARSGRKASDVHSNMLDALVAWILSVT